MPFKKIDVIMGAIIHYFSDNETSFEHPKVRVSPLIMNYITRKKEKKKKKKNKNQPLKIEKELRQMIRCEYPH